MRMVLLLVAEAALDPMLGRVGAFDLNINCKQYTLVQFRYFLSVFVCFSSLL